MTTSFRIAAAVGAVLLSLTGCTGCQGGKGNASAAGNLPAGLKQPPAAPREFRAAWVATVDNIDWPSKKGLPVEQQKGEIIAILDRAQQLKLNCLIVQVRTTCDAFYNSQLEPWSVYLTGKQGVAPNPYYDPLQMWIEEGHKRGIEIHAWFNPYRARQGRGNLEMAANHVSRRNPSIVRDYGPHLWMDPGEPLAAKQTLAVFDDVVRRYDIDGIHIDDYFYPYRVKTTWEQDAKNPDPDEAERKRRAAAPDLQFPDDLSWSKYKRDNPLKPNPATKPGDVERVARDDWRRDNVNKLVEQIHTQTKARKSWVKFGISPFGIGRPGLAPGIKGFDQYEELYADAALWLRNGWCDYFTPQLYWEIEKKEQSFPVLLDYWRSENKTGKHIWPGLFTSKVGDAKRSYKPGEIAAQINVTREQPDAGHVHFSMKALQSNQGDRGAMNDILMSQTYTYDALVPASPWLDGKAPPKPRVTVRTRPDAIEVTLAPGSGEKTWQYGIWRAVGTDWQFHVAPAGVGNVKLPIDTRAVVVTAVDRNGNESERVSVPVK